MPLIVAAAVIILLRLLQIGWTRDPGLPALCLGLVCLLTMLDFMDLELVDQCG